MKNNFILFVFSIITIFSYAQGPEYDEWYILYDNNGFKVKVNIFVAEDKDVCINDKHISINYQYAYNPNYFFLFTVFHFNNLISLIIIIIIIIIILPGPESPGSICLTFDFIVNILRNCFQVYPCHRTQPTFHTFYGWKVTFADHVPTSIGILLR